MNSARSPERAARGEHAELDRGVVGVEERAHVPQALAVGVELAVGHEVHDDEAPGGREALELAAMGAQQLARRGDEAPVGQALARALDARVGEGGPQARGVVADLGGPSSGSPHSGSS